MKKHKKMLRPIDQRMFKSWQALFMAFYSRRLYVDVAKRWRGFGILHCFLVIAIAAIPLSIKSMYDFSQYFDMQYTEALESMPDFKIDRGQLVFDYFMPYEVKNRKGEVVIVIDNHTSLNQINFTYPNWMLFIAADAMYFRAPQPRFGTSISSPGTIVSKQITMQPFENVSYDYFNATAWLKQTHFSRAKWYAIMLIYPVLTASLFGFLCTVLLLMSAAGRIFSTIIFKHKIKFKQSYRLMSVASSAGICLLLIGASINPQLPLLGFYVLVAMILYYCFAILAVRRESKSMVLL